MESFPYTEKLSKPNNENPFRNNFMDDEKMMGTKNSDIRNDFQKDYSLNLRQIQSISFDNLDNSPQNNDINMFSSNKPICNIYSNEKSQNIKSNKKLKFHKNRYLNQNFIDNLNSPKEQRIIHKGTLCNKEFSNLKSKTKRSLSPQNQKYVDLSDCYSINKISLSPSLRSLGPYSGIKRIRNFERHNQLYRDSIERKKILSKSIEYYNNKKRLLEMSKCTFNPALNNSNSKKVY